MLLEQRSSIYIYTHIYEAVHPGILTNLGVGLDFTKFILPDKVEFSLIHLDLISTPKSLEMATVRRLPSQVTPDFGTAACELNAVRS
jgi:hypothetical protein